MLLASLFRNFLLAQRVFARFDLHPSSCPPIPAAHTHPLWDSWDLAVETLLVQLVSPTEAADRATERYIHIYVYMYTYYVAIDTYIERYLRIVISI